MAVRLPGDEKIAEALGVENDQGFGDYKRIPSIRQSSNLRH